MTPRRILLSTLLPAALAGCVLDASDAALPEDPPIQVPTPAPPGPAAWTEPAHVPLGLDGVPSAPALATGGERVALAFHLFRDEPTDIYATFRTEEGWTAPENVSRSATPSSAPRAAYGADGALHVVWGERTSNPSQRPGGLPTALYHAVRRNGGWSAPVELFRTASEGLSPPRSLAVAGDGSLHVAYSARDPATSRYAVFHQRWSGGAWTTPRKVGFGLQPDLAVGPAGELYVAFLEADTSGARVSGRDVNSVWVSRSGDGGGTWSAPVRVYRSGRQPGYFPRLLATTTEMHLLWLRDSGDLDTNPDQVVHSRSSDGATWTVPLVVTPGLTGVARSLEGVVDEGGRLHVTFQMASGVAAPPFRPYYAAWAEGAWSAPEQVFGSQSATQQIAIAAADGGALHLALGATDLGTQRGLYHDAQP